MTTINTNLPYELEAGIYWLGMRRNVRLETNTYLLMLKRKVAGMPLLIDPGGPNVFNTLIKHLHSLLGGLKPLRLSFLSNQDPDVGINISYLLKHNHNLAVICTDDVWRLAYTLGMSSARFQSVEKLHNACIRLSTEQVLRFIPVPFCPTHGSCMLYDEQSRILFSGALFGGITFTPDLFISADHWEGIRMWHQMYIPTHKALHDAVKKVRELDPPPRIIAPQHGGIIPEDQIPFTLDRLSELPVGLDIAKATEIDKIMYIEAINDVMGAITEKAGQDVMKKLLHKLNQDRSFPHLFTFKKGQLIDIKDDILGDVMGGFKMFLYAFLEDQPPEIQNIIRDSIMQSSWNLPMFMQTFVHRGKR